MNTTRALEEKNNLVSFVVLKFGGTSVSSLSRWETIRDVALARINEGYKPVIVCSALSGVSNTLENIIKKIQTGHDCERDLELLREKHFHLGQELNVEAEVVIGDLIDRLSQILLGCSLVSEVSPRVHAQIMAFGELMSTRLGANYLQKTGLHVAFEDARESLTVQTRVNCDEQRRFLNAQCAHEESRELQTKFADIEADAIITQGFIAKDESGHTVLLGRGGSDTSAAYFAAKLNARRCEIWTDVHGLYSANPKEIPSARLLKQLDYKEAQEMATSGAKVLHPRCLAPVMHAQIPLQIRCTLHPKDEGTVISKTVALGAPRVKCVSKKSDVTLVSIESLGMWHEVGFLADFFTVFKSHGLSIDLISTSETNITVSIDSASHLISESRMQSLAAELSKFGKVQVLSGCATVSLVGRNIRSILHQLGPALQVFEEQKVYLVSQASSDLNLSFVVQEDEAHRMVRELHHLLFDGVKDDAVFSPLIEKGSTQKTASGHHQTWWQKETDSLVDLAKEQSPQYAYHAPTLERSAKALLDLESIDRVFYAMKANDNEDVLRTFYDLGLGFECVSVFELDYIFELFPQIDPSRVLFTPNFAPRLEYEQALKKECHLTLDNLFPLEKWPELFECKDLILRLDPGRGFGHHKYVQTAGEQSKFGISMEQIDASINLIKKCKAKVKGLHVHAGSGITRPSYWLEMAQFLIEVSKKFENIEILNLGGGLFVPSQLNEEELDLQKFDEALMSLRASTQGLELWLEPGRFLVATAGVLLARVTQVKEKKETRFVGLDAGMNALIRPALYGAYHPIVNLSQPSSAKLESAHIVGPICESGDTLGYNRSLPVAKEGDVILVANTGAYGSVMSSRYNRRPKLKESFLR